MTTKYVLEDVSLVENDFSADSRGKDGTHVVSYEPRRSIKLHLAIDHIVQIEVAKDVKLEDRSIVTLSSGQRYVTRRSAAELCTAIDSACTDT
jgi:hypothetical protein